MTLYNEAFEVPGLYVRVAHEKYTGLQGTIIEVGAHDGGMVHGCVKIHFDEKHPDWSTNEQWFLSGYLTEGVKTEENERTVQ